MPLFPDASFPCGLFRLMSVFSELTFLALGIQTLPSDPQKAFYSLKSKIYTMAFCLNVLYSMLTMRIKTSYIRDEL